MLIRKCLVNFNWAAEMIWSPHQATRVYQMHGGELGCLYSGWVSQNALKCSVVFSWVNSVWKMCVRLCVSEWVSVVAGLFDLLWVVCLHMRSERRRLYRFSYCTCMVVDAYVYTLYMYVCVRMFLLPRVPVCSVRPHSDLFSPWLTLWFTLCVLSDPWTAAALWREQTQRYHRQR